MLYESQKMVYHSFPEWDLIQDVTRFSTEIPYEIRFKSDDFLLHFIHWARDTNFIYKICKGNDVILEETFPKEIYSLTKDDILNLREVIGQATGLSMQKSYFEIVVANALKNKDDPKYGNGAWNLLSSYCCDAIRQGDPRPLNHLLEARGVDLTVVVDSPDFVRFMRGDTSSFPIGNILLWTSIVWGHYDIFQIFFQMREEISIDLLLPLTKGRVPASILFAWLYLDRCRHEGRWGIVRSLLQLTPHKTFPMPTMIMDFFSGVSSFTSDFSHIQIIAEYLPETFPEALEFPVDPSVLLSLSRKHPPLFFWCCEHLPKTKEIVFSKKPLQPGSVFDWFYERAFRGEFDMLRFLLDFFNPSLEDMIEVKCGWCGLGYGDDSKTISLGELIAIGATESQKDEASELIDLLRSKSSLPISGVPFTPSGNTPFQVISAQTE